MENLHPRENHGKWRKGCGMWVMRDPRSSLGVYETNPARQDVEDIGQLMGIQFALSLILNNDIQYASV